MGAGWDSIRPVAQGRHHRFVEYKTFDLAVERPPFKHAQGTLVPLQGAHPAAHQVWATKRCPEDGNNLLIVHFE